MGAQAVHCAGANARDMPMKHVAQSAGKLDPRRLDSRRVEKANEYGLGAA